ncbi:MAG: glycosyltransferase family 39 protein [Candidatus Latescibacteria bacterium]|nr:glycosyltransferase family 39 protein [Candidatus Latescibacterota bacterium]
MARDTLYALLLAALLLIGSALRLVGLTRGDSDLVLPEQHQATLFFYRFHPDEEMVIWAALSPDFDLLNPPLTVYGVLPVYALRGALALASLCGWSVASLDDPDSARHVYYVARILAVLCSCGVLLLVWRMGCRYFNRPVAALALAIAAFAPGAIQQAHFFIVDGFFVLLSAAAIHAALQALTSGTRRNYVLAGLLIGATAAVRLNGLLLGLVLLAGHLARGEREWPQFRRRWCQPELWLAGGAATGALLLVEPYLVARPELLWRAEGSGDFGLAVKVTRGEILQPWTLVDVHTIPYLDHWGIWSLATGWPLTFLFVFALPYVLWRERRRPVVLMALWCGLYFLLIGQLQARAVRYLIPMLPFMALFAGALLAASWQAARPWIRQGGKLVSILVMGHLVFKGVAFARIYGEEDSRIQAGKWVSSHVPKDSHVGVEGGGFSMQGLISGQDYQQVVLDVTRVFYGYPYLSCRAQLDFLEERLQDMEYLALTDVNRYAQFTAVPEIFPVVAGLYERLAAGELGFELVQRFKTYPALLGLVFADDRAEPSFLGYDHPTVWIFKSRGKAAIGEAFTHWERELAENPGCPDRSLEQVAAQVRARDWAQAEAAAHTLLEAYPDLALGYWLLAQIHRQQGNPDSAALAHFQPENLRAAHVLHTGTVHYIPANTALSLSYLGLGDLALQVLREGVGSDYSSSAQAAEQMAQSYLEVAKYFFSRGDLARMEQAVELSTRIFGIKEACNILALTAQQRGEPEQALKWWEQSLLVEADQADIHRRAGLVALLNLGQRDKARYHLGRAVALDPSLQAGIAAALRAAQGDR